jgi:hypothetical protein
MALGVQLSGTEERGRRRHVPIFAGDVIEGMLMTTPKGVVTSVKEGEAATEVMQMIPPRGATNLRPWKWDCSWGR